jgi:hypothetical protein
MRHVLERDGATFKCRNEDFAVSTHPDFHPTDVFEDADGSILRRHRWLVPHWSPTSQIAKPQVKGAIYRIRRKGATPPVDPRGLLVKWDSLSAPEIAALLDDPRFAVRDRAVQQLAGRGDEVVANMQEILRKNRSVQARQNLAWAINRIPSETTCRTALHHVCYDPRGVRVYHQGERSATAIFVPSMLTTNRASDRLVSAATAFIATRRRQATDDSVPWMFRRFGVKPRPRWVHQKPRSGACP